MPAEVFGYSFKNPALLEEALTTPSFRMSTPDAKDNQRLEFLGDAVLGLLAASRVFNGEESAGEGRLTVRRAHMVSTAALCAAADRHGLAPMLRRNKGAAELPRNSKTFADAVEAIVGAAWLDGGMDAASAIFDALGLDANSESGAWADNPKGELQMRAQALVPPRHPAYTLVKTAGMAHAPIFTVRVEVEGVGSAEASAGSRKEAESKAAAELLRTGALPA